MFQDFFVRSKNGFVHAAVMWVWVAEAGRQGRVVLPLPNENKAIRCLTDVTRALNYFAFFRPWLTLSAEGETLRAEDATRLVRLRSSYGFLGIQLAAR